MPTVTIYPRSASARRARARLLDLVVARQGDQRTYLDEIGRTVDRLEALPVLERVAAVGELLDAAAVLLAASRWVELEAGVDPLEVAAELERDANLVLARRG